MLKQLGNLRGMATRAKRGSKKAAAAAANSAASTSKGGIDGFGQMVHPSLQLHGLNSRYANALYSVASKEKKLDVVEKELLEIQAAAEKSENFRHFLKNPTIARHAKKAEIGAVMKEAKYSKPVAGLFSVLAENGRLPYTSDVINAYKQLMASHRQEIKAVVVSADPLSSSQLKQVETALGSHIKKGEKLMLETKVDPEILGGLKVHIGTMFIDLSLSTKINKIHSILANPVQ